MVDTGTVNRDSGQWTQAQWTQRTVETANSGRSEQWTQWTVDTVDTANSGHSGQWTQ